MSIYHFLTFANRDLENTGILLVQAN